jgi:hypothetical protein
VSVLVRIVAALLIAVPALLVLVIVFALAGRRRTSLALESRSNMDAGSSPREALLIKPIQAV